MRCLVALLLCVLASFSLAQAEPENGSAAASADIQKRAELGVEELEEPLYSPFIERYFLDELRSLRVDLANQRAELIQQVVDRELSSVDRGVTYATNTVTYFFYLIAAVSSILVLLGWNSLRDIKEKMGLVADEEVNKLINAYEVRLRSIEKQLTQKTEHIDANRDEIARTKEIHSLWLRAGLESSAPNKIAIYDQILAINPEDVEALTYKADLVLEQDEPQWSVNLCQQALSIDPGNAHAFYQLACAHTALQHYDEAVHYLKEAVTRGESYREELLHDPALEPLRDLVAVKELLGEQENENADDA